MDQRADIPGETGARRRIAFATLVRAQQTNLLRASRRLCRGDDDRAQDLIQDTLVRAYEAYTAGKFQADAGALWPWLLRILTNLFINDYNRRRKWDAGIDLDTLTASGSGGPEQTHAPAADIPGQALLTSTLDEELEEALAALPETMRVCVILVDMEGLEYAEAAKALAIPIGTVRSRLARARMQLYDRLQDYARRKRLI